MNKEMNRFKEYIKLKRQFELDNEPIERYYCLLCKIIHTSHNLENGILKSNSRYLEHYEYRIKELIKNG